MPAWQQLWCQGSPGGGRGNDQRFLRTQILLGEAGRARVLRSLYFVNKH